MSSTFMNWVQKRTVHFTIFFGFLLVALALPSSTAAQQVIKCESNDGHRQYCGIVDPDAVNLQRQISGSPCELDRTWGVDRQGLWVDRGCRAVFYVRAEGGGWAHRRDDDPWPPRGDWNGGNWERGGACFYTDPGFRGDYFCMRRGDRRASLGDYGDRISSIRVFGRARVVVFNDRNFESDRDVTDRDIDDLRNWPVTTKRPHTWNNRISSIRVQ
jgi:hypothetical protein